MIEQLLAISYYEKKEKALKQRKNIDYTMKEQLSELKNDHSMEAKVKVKSLESEIEKTELQFNTTIEEIRKVHNDLFPFLEKTKALKESPFVVHNKSCHFGIYIDRNKNIHYNTM